MIPRIKAVMPLPNFQLGVQFDDGKIVLYNVKEDMDAIADYRDLADIHGLFDQVQLDESRTCVFWNDRIDLPSDTIYEYAIRRLRQKRGFEAIENHRRRYGRG